MAPLSPGRRCVRWSPLVWAGFLQRAGARYSRVTETENDDFGFRLTLRPSASNWNFLKSGRLAKRYDVLVVQ